MSNNENLARQYSAQPARRVTVRHIYKVVSELPGNNDVDVVERVVHFGHIGQMPGFQTVAAESLKVETGRPVDTFERSTVIDLQAWREKRKIGEYHKSESGDTFAYTEIVEKGSERLPVAITTAFTSRSRADVIQNLGQPEQSAKDNLVQFPVPQTLRPTG